MPCSVFFVHRLIARFASVPVNASLKECVTGVLSKFTFTVKLGKSTRMLDKNPT